MASQSTNLNYTPHLNPEKGASLKWLDVACVTLTGIAIILRFWSRATSSKKKFGADDWTALASWPLVATLNLIVVELMGTGFGRHVEDVPLADIRKGLILVYASWILYALAITMIRVSAILFYNRVFELRSSRYRYVIWCSLGMNMAWLLALGIVLLVPCTPVHAFWDKPLLASASYTCLSTRAIQLSSGISSVLMDLLVLLLPVPCLLKLQTDRRRKTRVGFIFFIGYCVIFFTVGRLIAIARAGKALDEDFTWAFVTPLYWYACEISVASICISLPSIFRLVRRATSHGPTALLNDREYPTDTSRSRETQIMAGENGFVRLIGDTKHSREHQIPLESLEPGNR
ncbi:hypothetical protein BDR22DRAFT_973712 [Usnea florida]